MDDYLVTVLSNIGMISFIALSAYLLLITGEISFGQQAYFGLGAYAAGAATAMFELPIWTAILVGSSVAGLMAMVVGALTLRLSGLYFSISTLAFAEMVRLILLIVKVQVEVDGEMVGPDGSNGFHDIRWMFERDISLTEFMFMIYGLLALVLIALIWMERSRLGTVFRMLGSDDLLAEMQGLNTVRYRILAAGLAGGIAGVGGALYAHFTTYVEPQFFNVMLGVHALAYGLIGGLGTAFGPLIGVAIDLGFLEAVRFIQGYRMIVFGGLVAVLLILMPRGLLDEERVHRLKTLFSRRNHAGARGP
ncbi:MAG: branched-chain amino acid ABC transporter permease [bacterium]|nr:branched-chain amino acid ABC transporter permease [bacterium]